MILYHNPRCSKSRETLKLLQDKGFSPTVVEYLKNPPSPAELAGILAKLGKSPAQVIRKKEAAEAGLEIGSLDDAALIQAMADHPAIIERPILVAGDKAALGRPPETVLEIL